VFVQNFYLIYESSIRIVNNIFLAFLRNTAQKELKEKDNWENLKNAVNVFVKPENLLAEIVFSFDQSFSRGGDALEQMGKKLSLLKKEGAVGFYYDSHARFLFSAKSPEVLANLERHLVAAGLPEKRFINQ